MRNSTVFVIRLQIEKAFSYLMFYSSVHLYNIEKKYMFWNFSTCLNFYCQCKISFKKYIWYLSCIVFYYARLSYGSNLAIHFWTTSIETIFFSHVPHKFFVFHYAIFMYYQGSTWARGGGRFKGQKHYFCFCLKSYVPDFSKCFN